MTTENGKRSASLVLSETKEQREHIESLLDDALDETFPASDPIAVSPSSKRDSRDAASNADPRDASEVAQNPGTVQATDEPTLFAGAAARVQQLLPTARERLTIIAQNVQLVEVAQLLHAGADIVVVCSPEEAMVGIITKTDVVGQIGGCQGASCVAVASAVMVRDVVVCHPMDLLSTVWTRMKEQGLKNVPILDNNGRPVGVLNARDALEVLLQGVEEEESLLRDYVMGVGYR